MRPTHVSIPAPPSADAPRHGIAALSLRDPRRPADGRARHDDRQRRAAPHPGGVRVLEQRPVMGAQRVHPHLRRLSPARRSRRRSLRPAPRVPRRHRAVHRQLAPRWTGGERMDVPRGSSRAGPRRRTGRAVRAVTAHECVPRRTRANPRDRALHDGVCRRRGARPRLRWLAHRARVVALGHVRQRAHRRRHLGHRPPDHPRIGAPSRSLRSRRCGHLDRRHDPHRLRSRRVRVGGLDAAR